MRPILLSIVTLLSTEYDKSGSLEMYLLYSGRKSHQIHSIRWSTAAKGKLFSYWSVGLPAGSGWPRWILGWSIKNKQSAWLPADDIADPEARRRLFILDEESRAEGQVMRAFLYLTESTSRCLSGYCSIEDTQTREFTLWCLDAGTTLELVDNHPAFRHRLYSFKSTWYIEEMFV